MVTRSFMRDYRMRRSCLALLSTVALAGCVAPPLTRGPPPGSVRYAAVPYQPPPRPAGFADTIRNPIVRDIQRQLRRHGFYPGPTDGINTPQTVAAIQSFQASHRLAPDGIASPYLLGVLRNTPPGT